METMNKEIGKKSTVIHIISSLGTGGAETMVRDYALLMDKSKFSVLVISIDKCYHTPNDEALKSAGIPVLYLSELRYSAELKINKLQKVKKYLLRYYDLYSIIKQNAPCIVHAHLDVCRFLKYIPSKKWNINLFYTVHNVTERFFGVNPLNKEKYRAYLGVKRLIKKQDMWLIALHEGLETELKQLFHTQNVITVHNGVRLDRFKQELYTPRTIRKKIGIPQDAFVIGHVGRFHEQKNHDLIVDIFNEVAKLDGNAFLLMIGNGDLKNSVEEKIKWLSLTDKVKILSNRNDIPELMSTMDVFLFPSKWEGFGNVLIEAQSMGLPCVISDKVPKSAIFNANVKVLSLNQPISQWVNMLLLKENTDISPQITRYDIQNTVKKLEKIYLGNEKINEFN